MIYLASLISLFLSIPSLGVVCLSDCRDSHKARFNKHILYNNFILFAVRQGQDKPDWSRISFCFPVRLL